MSNSLPSMAFKIFLDANVLLDFFLKRGNYLTSKALIEKVVEGEYQAFITPSIVHLIGYWLSKTYGNVKAKEIILELLTDVQVIDCSHTVTINALNSKMADIEDALQYYTAMHHKLDFFISQDKRLKRDEIPTLPVYSPDNFLER